MSTIKSPLLHEMKASPKPLNADNFISRHENSPSKLNKKKDSSIKPNSLINFLGVKSENKSKLNEPLKFNNNDKQCSLEEELESCNINEQAPFKPKTNKIKECIMHTISEESKKKISCILDEVYQLSDVEKLLLYLQLPTGLPTDKDLLKQRSHCMSLGKKAEAEVNQTYSWIQSHLEEDPNISLPKQEVYNEYKAFCEANDSEALCAADFGKVMKHVFPGVKPRRLGTRGNSRYCYSGLRKKLIVEPPLLPNITDLQKSADSLTNKDFSTDVFQSTFHLIMEWAEKLLGRKFSKLEELACHLVESSYVDNRSVAAYTLLSATDNHHLLDKEIQANSSKVSNGKKRESQIHLQRKLHEKELLKEQKKKLQEQKCQFSKSPRKTPKPRSISQPQFDFTEDFKISGDTNSSELELVDAAEDIKLSPKKIFDKVVKSDNNCDPVFNKAAKSDQQRTAKVGIPRNCSSGAVCLKPTNIIMSPVQITLLNSNPPSVPQKYKPIQPKPFSARSQSSSTPINFSNSASGAQAKSLEKPKKVIASQSFSPPEENENANIIKREERSILETFCMKNQDVLPEANRLISEIKRERKSKSPEHITNSVKRHSDEMDTHELVSKKPYLESILNPRELLDADNSPWTNSECHEMLGGLNVSKLSKDIISLKKPLDLEDVSLHQIETDASLEYFNDIDIEAMNEPINSTLNPNTSAAGPIENNDFQIVQLRMLLKQNLPSKVLNSPNKSQDIYTQQESSDTNSELHKALFSSDLKSLYSSNSQQPLLVKSDSSTSSYVESYKRDNSIESNMNSQSTLVPSSPDTRRLAFNFQPIISHRQTPMAENYSSVPSPQINQYLPSSNMISVAVGPSRPTSAANSPFVSPRTTPIPSSRSRNNSGQNNPRHTPFQNFDSGVSSVSSSPFISPQPTPLPGPHRLRHNSSIVRSISFSSNQAHSLYSQHRARHSSGPGGPIGMHSPMMHDVRSNSVDTSLLRSRHNSTSTTILSPVPEQTLKQQTQQPSSSFNQADEINLLAADDFLRGEHLNKDNPTLIHNSLKPSLSPNSNPATLNGSEVAPQINLKHFSNEFIDLAPCDSLSQEVQSYLKNSSYTVSFANRSQSVPLHQMLHPSSKQCLTPQMTESESFSKSYPSTPVGNQMFIFETDTRANNLTENFPQPESSNSGVMTDTWEPLQQKNDVLDQSSEEDLQSALEVLQDFGEDFKFDLPYNPEGDIP